MKKVFFISVLFCANFLMVRASEPFVTHAFPASSIKAIDVVTSGGYITVNGDAGSEAVVEVYVSRDKWSFEKIQEVLEENYTLDVKVEGGKLYAVAKSKTMNLNWNRLGLNISFKITVPRQVNSNLRTSGGSIQISNLSGSQDFTTSGGSLTVENVSGNIVGRTSGGGITVTNTNDNIDLKTSGGSITAKDCSGKMNLKTSGGSLHLSNLNGNIDASTSGGSLHLNNLSGNIKTKTSGGSVTAKNVQGVFHTGTSGGSVNLDDISGSVDARTSGGSINVNMESVSEYVKLSNSGNISLTLPADKGYNLKVKGSKVETSNLRDFRGNMESKSLEGTTSNGGPNIEVKTSQRATLTFK